MEVHLIWAQDKNGGIGTDGNLPWHISEDLKNFKKITLNSTIIMGRKTWDSLPVKPLPNRINIVFSKSLQRNAITCNSFEQCIEKLNKKNIRKIFIIGGRSIYKMFFNDATFLHITKIKFLKDGINEFFPFNMKEIEKNFVQISNIILSDNAEYTCWKSIK